MNNIAYSNSECFFTSSFESWRRFLLCFAFVSVVALPLASRGSYRTEKNLTGFEKSNQEWLFGLRSAPSDDASRFHVDASTWRSNRCMHLITEINVRQTALIKAWKPLPGKAKSSQLFMTVSMVHTDTVVIVYMSNWEGEGWKLILKCRQLHGIGFPFKKEEKLGVVMTQRWYFCEVSHW